MLRLVVASPGAFSPRGLHDRRVVITDSADSPLAYGSRIGDGYSIIVPEVASFHFRPGSQDVAVQAEPLVAPERVLDAYYGAALPMAVQVVLERQPLHASAVVVPGIGAVAFAGVTHSGKTTLAYGLSRRGFPMWADDILAIDAFGVEGVSTIRLPYRLNLRAPSAAYFEGRPETGVARGEQDPGEWATAPLVAFCVLERRDRRPRAGSSVVRLPPTEGLMALLAQAFWFEPQTSAERRQMMRDYLEVVARVPGFRVSVGPSLDALPALLDEVEAKVAACLRPAA